MSEIDDEPAVEFGEINHGAHRDATISDRTVAGQRQITVARRNLPRTSSPPTRTTIAPPLSERPPAAAPSHEEAQPDDPNRPSPQHAHLLGSKIGVLTSTSDIQDDLSDLRG